MRRGTVYYQDAKAGSIEETADGTYIYSYNKTYLSSNNAHAVSLTLPLRAQPYESNDLFPFFDGLIPEGWLLDLTVRNWKVSHNDRMGLLLEACESCIGAVSVIKDENTP